MLSNTSRWIALSSWNWKTVAATPDERDHQGDPHADDDGDLVGSQPLGAGDLLGGVVGVSVCGAHSDAEATAALSG